MTQSIAKAGARRSNPSLSAILRQSTICYPMAAGTATDRYVC